jgi:hypothetical protein
MLMVAASGEGAQRNYVTSSHCLLLVPEPVTISFQNIFIFIILFSYLLLHIIKEDARTNMNEGLCQILKRI